MSSIDHEKLFEQYYQKEYDFNTASLSADEISDIKKLVREKRVDYALAPMGTNIFGWILDQNKNIRFELVPFASEKIDGMLYIPTTGKERAYIILNANKPLINQIFAAAHEYYHYVKDYQRFKEMPYICDFNMLNDVNEMRACRFAAEILLPEEALAQEVMDYRSASGIVDSGSMGFIDFAALSILLTVKYQMPLKAVMYRLVEERYIDNIDRYIKSYEFVKKVLQDIEIFKKRVGELYSRENSYIVPYSYIYRDMEQAFADGNASREDILRDAKTLGLDMDIINDFLTESTNAEDIGDDELFAMINRSRG